jgi:hypothetical protein
MNKVFGKRFRATAPNLHDDRFPKAALERRLRRQQICHIINGNVTPPLIDDFVPPPTTTSPPPVVTPSPSTD